jgi:hypothetical protein
MLIAMKEVEALDVSGDGFTDDFEFKRLANASVLTAAAVKLKADTMWKGLVSAAADEIATAAADEVDASPRKKLGMKSRSMAGRKSEVDAPGATLGSISRQNSACMSEEFDATVMLMSRVGRLSCWATILADDDLAGRMGDGNAAKGKL